MKRPDLDNLLDEVRTFLTTIVAIGVVVTLVILFAYWLDRDFVGPLLFPAGKPWQK